jgi:hypothetical protein
MARITIPLDASGIDNLDTKQPVKVLLTSDGKALASKVVALDEKGQALLSLDVDGRAPGLRVIVGPADASDDDLLGLQTLAVDVPSRRWLGRDELVIPALRITPYYWFWWLRWCRTFTIRDHGCVGLVLAELSLVLRLVAVVLVVAAPLAGGADAGKPHPGRAAARAAHPEDPAA